MDDTRTIRTRTSSQLRELDTHLAVAAEALSRPDLRPEQARESLESRRAGGRVRAMTARTCSSASST